MKIKARSCVKENFVSTLDHKQNATVEVQFLGQDDVPILYLWLPDQEYKDLRSGNVEWSTEGDVPNVVRTVDVEEDAPLMTSPTSAPPPKPLTNLRHQFDRLLYRLALDVAKSPNLNPTSVVEQVENLLYALEQGTL